MRAINEINKLENITKRAKNSSSNRLNMVYVYLLDRIQPRAYSTLIEYSKSIPFLHFDSIRLDKRLIGLRASKLLSNFSPESILKFNLVFTHSCHLLTPSLLYISKMLQYLKTNRKNFKREKIMKKVKLLKLQTQNRTTAQPQKIKDHFKLLLYISQK